VFRLRMRRRLQEIVTEQYTQDRDQTGQIVSEQPNARVAEPAVIWLLRSGNGQGIGPWLTGSHGSIPGRSMEVVTAIVHRAAHAGF